MTSQEGFESDETKVFFLISSWIVERWKFSNNLHLQERKKILYKLDGINIS